MPFRIVPCDLKFNFFYSKVQCFYFLLFTIANSLPVIFFNYLSFSQICDAVHSLFFESFFHLFYLPQKQKKHLVLSEVTGLLQSVFMCTK